MYSHFFVKTRKQIFLQKSFNKYHENESNGESKIFFSLAIIRGFSFSGIFERIVGGKFFIIFLKYSEKIIIAKLSTA